MGPNLPLQSTRDVRRVNQQTLLKLVYFRGPISRLELSKQSGLSPATVTNLVNTMIAQELVIPDGFEESQGGRPRETLRMNERYGYIIGVEVAETHINAELFDVTLNVVDAVRFEISPDENHPQTIVNYIVEGIQQVQAQSGIAHSDIIAAGIGLPGIVNPVGGVSVYAPNWGWKDIPLLNMLHEKLDINFLLDNGKQALALAEAWFGAGRGCDDLAVLLIGTGIGAGIFSNGRLLRGATNSAGEWGHSCIDVNGPVCRCGSRGCVETFAGAPGIIRHLNELDPTSKFLKLKSQKAIMSAVCDAAIDEDDPLAMQVLDDVTRYLGAGIANLINIVNPCRIVIGGWCGELLNPYIIPRLSPAVETFALHEPFAGAEFLPTELEGVGISLGAASLVLEAFFTGELLAPGVSTLGEWTPI